MNNVVQIGEFRVTRTTTRHKADACKHWQFTIDAHGNAIECDDCHKQLDPVWALTFLCESYVKGMERAKRAQDSANAAENAVLHLKAAKRVEEVWRSRSMLPACPHCHRGIGPHDGLGRATVNKEMEMRRRAAISESEGAKHADQA